MTPRERRRSVKRMCGFRCAQPRLPAEAGRCGLGWGRSRAGSQGGAPGRYPSGRFFCIAGQYLTVAGPPPVLPSSSCRLSSFSGSAASPSLPWNLGERRLYHKASEASGLGGKGPNQDGEAQEVSGAKQCSGLARSGGQDSLKTPSG